jgi:hypothetical protein
MVEVQILDATSVSLDGVAVTGPLHVFGSSLVAYATTYEQGLILVDGSGATRALDHTALQSQLLPVFVCFLFFVGLCFGWFSGRHSAE